MIRNFLYSLFFHSILFLIVYLNYAKIVNKPIEINKYLQTFIEKTDYEGKHLANAIISLGEPFIRILRLIKAIGRLFSLAKKSSQVRASAVT